MESRVRTKCGEVVFQFQGTEIWIITEGARQDSSIKIVSLIYKVFLFRYASVKYFELHAKCVLKISLPCLVIIGLCVVNMWLHRC